MMNKKIFGIKISTIVSALVCLIAAILFWIMANMPEDTVYLYSDAIRFLFEGTMYV